MGRGQRCLWPFLFGQPVGLGQGLAMVPRAAAFEAARAHPPTSLGAHIVDGTDQTASLSPQKLGAMAILHRHVKPAIRLGQSITRDCAPGVFGENGDIAVVRAEAASAASHAIRGCGRQSMDRGGRRPGPRHAPSVASGAGIYRAPGTRNLRRRRPDKRKREGTALPSEFVP
jgi:hypothetical protein